MLLIEQTIEPLATPVEADVDPGAKCMRCFGERLGRHATSETLLDARHR
jgi:hypothetical protein